MAGDVAFQAYGDLAVGLALLSSAFGVGACGGAAIAITVTTSAPWWLIPTLILAPDVSYLAAVGGEPSDAPGAMPRSDPCANTAHDPSGPIVTMLVAALTESWTIALVSIIWAAHLTWDQAVGYNRRDADGTNYRVPFNRT